MESYMEYQEEMRKKAPGDFHQVLDLLVGREGFEPSTN